MTFTTTFAVYTFINYGEAKVLFTGTDAECHAFMCDYGDGPLHMKFLHTRKAAA